MSAEAYDFFLVLHAQVGVSLGQTAPAHIAALHSTVCVRTSPGSCRNQQYNPHICIAHQASALDVLGHACPKSSVHVVCDVTAAEEISCAIA